MKNIFILIVVTLLITACNKKKVKVPLIERNGKEEVRNNSAIWFFNKQGKLDVNEHNRISSTNWLFNIDKNLSLKEAFPEVKRLFIKHNEKSPHNTKPMKNYFTYVNTLNKQLSFYNFDSIQYIIRKRKGLKTISKDTLFIEINSSNYTFPAKIDSITVIQPIFNGNMNFQEYLSAKAKMEKLPSKKKLSAKEYIIID